MGGWSHSPTEVEVQSKDDDSVLVLVPDFGAGPGPLLPGYSKRVRRGEKLGGLTYEELAAAPVGSQVKLRKPLTDEERPPAP